MQVVRPWGDDNRKVTEGRRSRKWRKERCEVGGRWCGRKKEEEGDAAEEEKVKEEPELYSRAEQSWQAGRLAVAGR